MTFTQYFKFSIAHFIICAITCCFTYYFTSSSVSSAPPIARHFSTKGRYEEVNPHLIEDVLAVNTSQLPSAECRALHLTAIVRHGTRYPASENVVRMRRVYALVVHNASGRESWLRDLKNHWRMWYTEDMDGRLAEKGVSDLKHLAVRLSKLFPSLISEEKLRGGRVAFITSSKHRCVDSTASFQRGLTELWDIDDQGFDHEVNDTLMRFFDRCARFMRDVDDNPSAAEEVDKFSSGPEMKRVTQRIADRLHIPHSLIDDDVAQGAFDLCAYEFSIKNENSPWCRLFDADDARVLEYAHDLKHFWKGGHGHPINSKSSCVLFHDVFGRLDKAASESRLGNAVSEAATVQVGHAETLLPLLTLLGFFNDSERLTSANYAAQAQRSFRTSRFLPFTANLLLVLYDCGEDGLRLLPLLNEKAVVFPGMERHPASLPLYRDVRHHYRELLQGCDFEAECRLFQGDYIHTGG